MFMVGSIFASLSDPTLDLGGGSTPISFLEQLVEQSKAKDKKTLRDARHSQQRRMLREASATSTSDDPSFSSHIDIRSISEQVSKMIAKDVASFIDLENRRTAFTEETSIAADPETRQESNAGKATPTSSSKPVKVFIMMGQSNMVGQGEIYGDYDGTL